MNLQKQGTIRFWKSNAPIDTGTDALNFSNTLIQKSVQSKILFYFLNVGVPMYFLSYTLSVASNIFNSTIKFVALCLSSSVHFLWSFWTR